MTAKPPHILVIDDNEDILSTITMILHYKAYQVSAKPRIDDFEQSVTELSPDLILLDKNLGWADGCDLCRLIKSNQALASIPVIMFSAYYKKRNECMEAGADEFMEKPFEMKVLLDTIQHFCSKKGLQNC